MANVNKTVAKWCKAHPREVVRTEGRNSTEFSRWLIEQAQAGRTFQTMEQAAAEFATEGR